MATKRTASKKTTKRTKRVVVLAPKVRAFDLSGKPSDAEMFRQIGALKALQVSEGWILLRQTLEAQIAVLDRQIIDKRDVNGGVLSDAECDKLREQRTVTQGLVDKPELLLGQLERVEEDEPDDDPYYGRRSARPNRDGDL